MCSYSGCVFWLYSGGTCVFDSSGLSPLQDLQNTGGTYDYGTNNGRNLKGGAFWEYCLICTITGSNPVQTVTRYPIVVDLQTRCTITRHTGIPYTQAYAFKGVSNSYT
jgi:hypothetical protein